VLSLPGRKSSKGVELFGVFLKLIHALMGPSVFRCSLSAMTLSTDVLGERGTRQSAGYL
jgi:hypothetical protein